MRFARSLVGAVVILTAGCRGQPNVRDLVVARTLSCGVDHRHGAPLVVGAFFGDTIDSPQKVNAAMALYESRLGVPPRVVRFYANLSTPLGAPAPGRGLALMRAQNEGAIPMIVLEPTWRRGPTDRLLRRIANGEADSLVALRVRELASLQLRELWVELAPEMNSRFGAPWQADANQPNAPAAFADAWRQMVRIARLQNGVNIKWVWAPGVGNPYTHRATLDTHWNFADNYYPGDDVVDFVGLHAFNDPIAQGAWIPFVELVDGDPADHALSELIRRHPTKPVMLTEIASDEHPDRRGAKGAWIDAMFRELRACPSVAGLVWFDIRKERDWEINSSISSVDAFRAAVGGS